MVVGRRLESAPLISLRAFSAASTHPDSARSKLDFSHAEFADALHRVRLTLARGRFSRLLQRAVKKWAASALLCRHCSSL